MSLDGKILARARDRLAAERAANERRLRERRKEAYARSPRIREIDGELRAASAAAISAAVSGGGDPVEALESLRDRSLSLQEERGRELMRCGYPMDWLDTKYMCPVCRDTGYAGGEPCSCLMDIYRDEQRSELSGLLKLGEQTFDSFDLSLYGDEPDPRTGISPRGNMEVVYETCVEYARKFSKDSVNLFLSGGTGLGKTFLSTCIARVVSERGFSVVYDTAASVFAKYEDGKFGRGADPAEARGAIRRMETCDLFIMDDLGTELTTALTVSSLYTLLNDRLTAGKKTIINSNLSLDEMGARYSAPIMSRLRGEFCVLKFSGSDIRLRRR